MFCKNCGAEMPENATYCLSCGQAYNDEQTINNVQNQMNAQPQPSDKDGLAVTGFVLSLVSLFCCGFLSIIGIILSAIGMKSVNKHGFALAGLIIGIIAVIGWVLGIVFYSTYAQDLLTEIQMAFSFFR